MILLPKKATLTDYENYIAESFLYERFKLLMLNQFKWSGLEEFNIQERYVEDCLFDNGYCLFFEDKTNGKLCLPCYGEGGQNVYGEFLRYRATGFNYSYSVTAEESVLIENNKLRMPTQKAVLYFVSRLYELTRTMDVNVKQLKLQTLFSATDKNILTVKKIIDEIEQNNWAIITDSTMQLDEIVKAIPTGVKCLTQELTDRYNALMNEALTYFGINNSNTDKRERLITDEANANNQFIDSCAEMFLESRVRACEEINKKFGTNISVELRNKREQENYDNTIKNPASE